MYSTSTLHSYNEKESHNVLKCSTMVFNVFSKKPQTCGLENPAIQYKNINTGCNLDLLQRSHLSSCWESHNSFWIPEMIAMMRSLHHQMGLPATTFHHHYLFIFHSCIVSFFQGAQVLYMVHSLLLSTQQPFKGCFYVRGALNMDLLPAVMCLFLHTHKSTFCAILTKPGCLA